MDSSKKDDIDFKLMDFMKGNIKGELTISEHIVNFFYIVIICFALFFFTTCNFIAMSASLNLNKNDDSSSKYVSALIAFLFGFMYLTVYIMFYKIGQQKETIEFDKDKLFPI
jgi:hypothetical protein